VNRIRAADASRQSEDRARPASVGPFTIHDSPFAIEIMPTRTQRLGLLILMVALVVYVFIRVW
jgi:hypothetical protein